jgi:glycosyltransferase involved in cell wall biosynthesis
MMRPIASVILPAYNADRFLDKAVRSILRQDFRDFQFIIVDDGSADRTPEIIRDAARRDRRITSLFQATNTGLPRALNAALAHAQGKYVIRMDSDDIALPGRIGRQIAFMEENRAILASGTWAMRIDEIGLPLETWKPPTDHERIVRGRGGQIIHPTAIIRTEALRRIGGYLEQDWGYAEDLDLWLRLSEQGRVANLPEVLLRYRISQARISNAKRSEQLHEAERLCNLHRLKRGLPPVTIDKEYDRWCQREHFVAAAMRSGHIHTAAANWLLLRGTEMRRLVAWLRIVPHRPRLSGKDSDSPDGSEHER